jgi:hypothetical protein
MAPWRDQLTLEARLAVCPGAEIHLGCIHRTGVIWSYELRLSSTACQNDCKEKSYAPVAHFVGFGNVSEAKTGLQNCVPDDLIAGVHTPSLYQRSVSSPMDTSGSNNVQNNET